MKKKLSLICLCGIVLLGVCSCGNKDNDVDNKVPTPIKELKCNALNNVKYSFGDYFLTNDNDLYFLNTVQLYSNNENCLKINNESKIVKRIGEYFLDENNKVYFLKTHDSLEIVNVDGMHKGVYELLLDNNVINAYVNVILKTDGKLYKLKSGLSHYNKIDELTLYKEINDEKILEFGNYGSIRIKYETYSLDISGTYIKTDKAFYISTITNKECLKYADIECKYDFEKNEELTSKYNDIVIIKKNSYIAKDGKQYQLNN